MSQSGVYRIGLLPLLAALSLLQPVHGQAKPPGAEVSLDGGVLFTLHGRIGSFGVEERARAVNLRILALAEDTSIAASDIRVIDSDITSDIVYGERILVGLTDQDGAGAGRTRQDAAQRYAGAIRAMVTKYRQDHSRTKMLRGAAVAAAATVVLVLACWLMSVLIRRGEARLTTALGETRGAKFSVKLLGAERAVRMRRLARRVVWMAGLVGLLSLYVLVVSSQFPGLRQVERVMLQYLTQPLQSLSAQLSAQVPNLSYVLVILMLALGVNRLLRVCFDSVANESVHIPGFYPDWAEPTYKLAALVVFIGAAIIAFPYIPGSNSPAFQGISILAGVLFSIGSSSFLGNAFAGVILIYMRAFHVGDRVKIADTMGDIVEKSLLVTRVRTVKQEHITIANSMILGSHVVNYSRAALDDGLILYTSVTIGYDAPWRNVHELLLRAAKRTGGVSETPAPFVLQTSLHDSYVEYQINVYTRTPLNMTAIYSELRANIQDSFNEGGVEILSPSYHAMRDGNHNTIPRNYLPRDYEAPGFRVVKPGAMDGMGQ